MGARQLDSRGVLFLQIIEEGKISPTGHEFLGVVHHGPEEALQGLLQVVVQVVLKVYRQVVLQRIDRVLRLVVCFDSLGRLRGSGGLSC